MQASHIRVEEQTNYPLNIIIQIAGQVHISFKYNSHLLAADDVGSMCRHFKNVLCQIIAGATSLDDLDILNKDEHKYLTTGVNQTKESFPLTNTFADLFSMQALRSPGNIALAWRDEIITYKQLEERSNQLAHYLHKKGVTTESLVPICLERNIDIVIGMLAILKAGGAYIPIDPSYPTDRIIYMLEDSKAKLVITNARVKDKLRLNEKVNAENKEAENLTVSKPELSQHSIQVIVLEELTSIINEQPINSLPFKVGHANLAYVIYTSGSTGKPKGVMVEHKNLLNLIYWHINTFNVGIQSRATSMAGIGFDAFVWELWPYLTVGASVNLIENETRLSARALVDYLEGHDITHSFVPTAIIPDLIACAKGNLKEMKYLLTGGDKLAATDLKGIGFEVVNCYGPTENTVVASNYKLDKSDANLSPPIGKPIANSSIYLVNKFNKLVPDGVVGEIWIGGQSVARGYLNQSDLTNAKFIDNPFVSETSSKVYKTWDSGRRLPGGNIEYHGRTDDQVKIRGYRVELGEIEHVILKSGLVKQAVVLIKTGPDGNKMLVGYVVTNNNFEKENVLVYLYNRVPEYMVPATWVLLDKLPLTHNGKIDFKLLKTLRTLDKVNEYVAPETDIEKKLTDIWQKLLGIEKIGVYDNFFELGGNSLLVMRLVSYIENELKLTIPMNVIFQSRSIRDLSKYFEIQSHRNAIAGSEKFEVIDI